MILNKYGSQCHCYADAETELNFTVVSNKAPSMTKVIIRQQVTFRAFDVPAFEKSDTNKTETKVILLEATNQGKT